jgi:hypothetical protein
MLDSLDSRVIAVEAMSGFFVSQRNIVLDKLRPPKDSRGEPTKLEVAAYRRQFMSAFGHPEDHRVRLAGLAPLPPSWREGEAHQYLLASRLPGFPLMTLQCDEGSLTQCFVARGCFVEGLADMELDSIAGIATSVKRRLILVGDRKKALLHVFRFNSCHHIVHAGDISLPERLKEIANLSIDDADRLWITTMRPDDFQNANVFLWDADAW